MPYKKSNKSKSEPTARFTKMVKKVVREIPEKKWIEGSVASLAFDALPVSTDVCPCLDLDLPIRIDQGTNALQRIGDRIHLRSMDFRAVLVPTASTIGAVRIIIGQVIDQASATAALPLTYGQVLNGLSGAADYSCITAHYEHEPLTNYKILSDEVITWDATTAGAPRLVNYHFSKLALRNRNYEDATANTTGLFFYMLLSSNGVAVNLRYPRAKLVYTDM